MTPDFAQFFRAVHGHDPFPWQTEAAERLCRRETFAVTVQTGLGKSALVDAAVWAAGHGAWRRIAFVVDRRIVVDAVHQRAERLRQFLDESAGPARTEMSGFAGRLGAMQVVRLRGGVFGDDEWVLYPERVTVALTTVDQLGSRLMFRGYGVSPRRWPLHAGFFGEDTLVIVDEAHLAAPFLETLGALREHGAGVDVVPMSATLSAEGLEAVSLTASDIAMPVVKRRLAAKKLATLVEVSGAEADFVSQACSRTLAMLAEHEVNLVALVVNRVATARRCHARLIAQGVDAVLLTGRVRPADRDTGLAALLPRVRAGRVRSSDDRPLVVVATQTIEVGADFDFDALVTEAAPVSALRQRFGRLDRLGLRCESRGVILIRPDRDRDDPVYGAALNDAAHWLRQVVEQLGGTLDFGLDALEATLARHPAPNEARAHAATLLPTHVRMLAQTGPYAPELDLSAWLHGASSRAPDVTIVWRDDLLPDEPAAWIDAVQALPPMLREGLPMPLAAVRQWLTGQKAADDWGDAGMSPEPGAMAGKLGRHVLQWRGPDDCRVITAEELRPGDAVIVPSAYGGCDGWGWAPDSSVAVPDLADICLAERLESGATRRVVVRLAEGHWSALGPAADALRRACADLSGLLASAAEMAEDLEDEIVQARRRVVEILHASGHPLASRLHDPRVEAHPGGFVVRSHGIEEVEGIVETGRAVPLDVHHDDVARWARMLANGDPQARAIVDAAVIHDAGKAEARMQALLHGSAVAAARGPVLAKSALRRREEQLAAWKASSLPKGFRHEFASLDFVSVPDTLTRHLVATHHGFGRPWIVPCADAAAAGSAFAGLASTWLTQWSKQLSTHGAWALARMEWKLRAADARASIEEATA